uniref:Xyloside xylosyltransferase 1 n=1 Tax=Ailuropoda melanoleuca TaxID=9646 RepID=A0A7N5JM81_AILME
MCSSFLSSFFAFQGRGSVPVVCRSPPGSSWKFPGRAWVFEGLQSRARTRHTSLFLALVMYTASLCCCAGQVFITLPACRREPLTTGRGVRNTGREVRNVVFHDVGVLTDKLFPVVEAMQKHFSAGSGTYYSDSIFFLSVAMHQIMPKGNLDAGQ